MVLQLLSQIALMAEVAEACQYQHKRPIVAVYTLLALVAIEVQSMAPCPLANSLSLYYVDNAALARRTSSVLAKLSWKGRCSL